jgi:broad specificity phosphatase PhoE
MTTNLYLARHGETQWNEVQRYQGQLDSKLTQLGEEQSKNLALYAVNQRIDLIVSSPLGRAINTAITCQKTINKPIVNLGGITERNLGLWQGQYANDIKNEEHYDEILHQFTALKPTHGESAIDCGTRIFNTLKTLAKNHKDKNLLVIFHGEALRCFLAKIGQQSTRNAYDLFTNGCTLHLIYNHNAQHFEYETLEAK